MDKNKKATINSINKKDNKWLQYAVTVELNNWDIKKELQRITKINPFINKYNWARTNFSSDREFRKKLRKIIEQLLLMFCLLKYMYILLIFQKITQTMKKYIVLIIPKEERWYYLAVKKLSASLRGVASKHHGEFYCLNLFYSFATENKPESHKQACQKKIFVT